MEPPNKPLEGEAAARAPVSAIATPREQYAEHVNAKDIHDAIRNGRSVEQFKDTILAKMETAASDVRAKSVGMTPKEVERYSLGRAILAAATGDWSKAGLEREASLATGRLFGRTAEGFFIPFDYFAKRDFNVGTSTEAGNLVPDILRTDLYTDALRNAMVLGRMGLRILTGLSGNVDIPRLSSSATLAMLAEIGSASETNPNVAKHTLTPKRIEK